MIKGARVVMICVMAAILLCPAAAYAVPGDTTSTPRAGDSAAADASSQSVVPSAPTEADRNLPIDEQVTKFESALADLNTQMEMTSEQINASHDKLATIQKAIASRQAELTEVKKQYDADVAAYGERVRAAYQEGSLQYLDILLSAQDIPSLLSKYDFINRSTDSSAIESSEIAQHKKKLQDELAKLKEDELEARSTEFELAAKKVEMQHRQAEYQQLFDNASSKVLAQYNRNERIRKRDDSRMLSEFLRGGYTVEAGSVVETALAYQGIPYVWGGSSKSGMDCSGFVMYVFKQHGVSLPHSSAAQSRMGAAVSVSQLQPGDCVFFGSPVHHVGIYIGGEYFIHAPQTGDVVKISKLTNMSDYSGARRYNWKPRKGEPL